MSRNAFSSKNGRFNEIWSNSSKLNQLGKFVDFDEILPFLSVYTSLDIVLPWAVLLYFEFSQVPYNFRLSFLTVVINLFLIVPHSVVMHCCMHNASVSCGYWLDIVVKFEVHFLNRVNCFLTVKEQSPKENFWTILDFNYCRLIWYSSDNAEHFFLMLGTISFSYRCCKIIFFDIILY